MSKFIIVSTLSAALVGGSFAVAEAQSGGGTGGGGGTRSAPTTSAAPATTTTATTGTRSTTAAPSTTDCPPGLRNKPKNHPGRMAHPGCR